MDSISKIDGVVALGVPLGFSETSFEYNGARYFIEDGRRGIDSVLVVVNKEREIVVVLDEAAGADMIRVGIDPTDWKAVVPYAKNKVSDVARLKSYLTTVTKRRSHGL